MSHYHIVKQVLSKDQCELLADYANFKAKIKPSAKQHDDPLKGIHREYGDPLMETLLEKFTPLVETETGLQLWPTLSFYYTYKKGNQLLPHKDRSSCQYVAGVCLGVDAEYLEANNAPWPLVLNINGKPETIALDVGDMIIFKGHEIEHWREPFTGSWFVSAIFGYVDKQGPFAFQKYDQRKSLGRPHVGMFYWMYGCVKHRITRHYK